MFNEIFDKYPIEQVKEKIYNSTDKDVENLLNTSDYTPDNIHPLFSPAADNYLEKFAELSYNITRMRFGNTIQLYTPLYISNECNNSCLYCGYNVHNKIKRITLTPDQIEKETDIIFKNGFRHILLLTGEDKKAVPVEYLAKIGNRIHKKFSSVSIEVYPMEIEEYKQVIQSGIDGLTLYQETYDPVTYSKVHPSGKKRNFINRLNYPDKGGIAGFRKIGIGALLGLWDWRLEGFYTAIHALYLSNQYWRSLIQVSFPRLRDAPGGFAPYFDVSDKNLTHLITVTRMILNDAGIVLSTRESASLRDNLLPLGVTVMSAGSKTSPGGYSDSDIADNQFDIMDERTPEEISAVLKKKGFDPVWKDWDKDFII